MLNFGARGATVGLASWSWHGKGEPMEAMVWVKLQIRRVRCHEHGKQDQSTMFDAAILNIQIRSIVPRSKHLDQLHRSQVLHFTCSTRWSLQPMLQTFVGLWAQIYHKIDPCEQCEQAQRLFLHRFRCLRCLRCLRCGLVMVIAVDAAGLWLRALRASQRLFHRVPGLPGVPP